MPTPSRPNSASRSSRVMVDVSRLSLESQRMLAEAGSRSTTSKTDTDEPADVRPVIAHISSPSARGTTSRDGRRRIVPLSASTSEPENEPEPTETYVCRAKYLGTTCGVEVVETRFGWGHVAPRRWARAAIGRRA